MKKVSLLLLPLVLFAMLALPASAKEKEPVKQYVGIGMLLHPWTMSITTKDQKPSKDLISFVYISAMNCTGPGARAGLKISDRITAVAGKPLEGITPAQLHQVFEGIKKSKEGDSIALAVERGKEDSLKKFNTKVVLGKVAKTFSRDCK